MLQRHAVAGNRPVQFPTLPKLLPSFRESSITIGVASDLRYSAVEHVPDDVWRIIGEYVKAHSTKDFASLISVNRPLLYFVLEERYKEVIWATLDEAMLHRLERLQAPFIANCVRRVRMNPWFVQYLLRRSLLLESTSGTKKMLNTFLGALNIYRSEHSTPTTRLEFVNAAGKKKRHSIPLPNDIIMKMIDAVKNMVNVSEYHFEWRDLPPNKVMERLLATTWKTFNHKLRKLVLSAPIPKYEELLKESNFPLLEELDLSFVDGVAPLDEDGQKLNAMLCGSIASFVNQHRSSLRSLRLFSGCTCDLSQLFDALSRSLRLNSFTANNIDARCLLDVSSFTRFLKSQSYSLLHLHLLPTLPCSTDYKFSAPNQNQISRRVAWSIVENDLLHTPSVLSNLESLSLPSLHPSSIVSFLKRSVGTISSLRLSDYYLSVGEITHVLDVIDTRRLKRLHIQVERVDPALLKLLYDRVKGLKCLVLVFSSWDYDAFRVVPSEQTVDVSDWALFDLGTHVHRYYDGQSPNEAEEYRLFGNMLQWIPGIQLFKGGEHHLIRIDSRLPSVFGARWS